MTTTVEFAKKKLYCEKQKNKVIYISLQMLLRSKNVKMLLKELPILHIMATLVPVLGHNIVLAGWDYTYNSSFRIKFSKL